MITAMDHLTPQEEQVEEARIEQRCTVQEIFEEGLRRGWATAGLIENSDREYHRWLLERFEAQRR